MGREIPSSHRPWLFDEYQQRLEVMAATRGGARDHEVEMKLSVLTPRELDVVYHVAYDCLSVSSAGRLLGVSSSQAHRYWKSALRKLRAELGDPVPEWRPEDAMSAMLQLLD